MGQIISTLHVRALWVPVKHNRCLHTFSTAGSSKERSLTSTGMWALIFSFTASSSSWSWAGCIEWVSSSIVLLWQARSLREKQEQVNTQVLMCTEKMICALMYQEVVLYPNIVSARAVIKCWPNRQEKRTDYDLGFKKWNSVTSDQRFILPECCCMWSNLLSQSTFKCTSWPTSRGKVTKCKASGPCLVTLKTGTSPISPWSSGCGQWRKHCIYRIYKIYSLHCTIVGFVHRWDMLDEEHAYLTSPFRK